MLAIIAKVVRQSHTLKILQPRVVENAQQVTIAQQVALHRPSALVVNTRLEQDQMLARSALKVTTAAETLRLCVILIQQIQHALALRSLLNAPVILCLATAQQDRLCH